MSKELTVLSTTEKQALQEYSGQLFSDIDFDGLNQIIDKIATNKEELTDGMRSAASEYAKTWDQLVVERLKDKEEKLKTLEQFFMSRDTSYGAIKELIEGKRVWHDGDFVQSDDLYHALISIFNSKEEWVKYATELESLKQNCEKVQEMAMDRPCLEDYVVDPLNMTYHERVVAQREFELTNAKFELDQQKEQYKLRIQYNDFMKLIRKDKSFKDFKENLKAQIKMAIKSVKVVHEKSALVSMSVNFSGTDLLHALQELHDFQKTI